MDEDFDDDFGGFEVADADDDPITLDADGSLPTEFNSAGTGQDVSSIPWLAASLQSTAEQMANVPKAEAGKRIFYLLHFSD